MADTVGVTGPSLRPPSVPHLDGPRVTSLAILKGQVGSHVYTSLHEPLLFIS